VYLEKIELHGFKSFAHRTTIHFPRPTKTNHHGITAIVGPNGSGKSNIIDALRWVLGEQSTKTLRGKKGLDVIFSGSKTKSRMGMAEVTLYFDNKEKVAPIDYSEIIITRRLFRDGESEYLLNNNKVRLSDIVMLLAQCHVGQKSYSIIGQGMITELINATPTERKAFFDEATGIKQYQIQRDKAANKLKRTQDNLEQSVQILEELQPRLKLLQRQVNKLEQRKLLEQDLREYQSQYYRSLWQNLHTQKQQYEHNFSTVDAQRQQKTADLEKIGEALQALSATASRQEKYTELQNAFNELIFAKNTLTQELATIKGKTNVEYSKIGKQNLSWLELKEDEIRHNLDTKHQELTQQEDGITQLTSKTQLLQTELEQFKKKLQTIEDTMVQSQKDGNQNFVYKKTHIRTLLKQKNSMPGIHGTVNELGFVEKPYARALEIAAGRYTESIVTDNENTARDGINFLRENRLGTASFLPMSKIRGRRIPHSTEKYLDMPGVIGLAYELVSFDEQYDDIFSFIFGSTIVVDKLETAKKIGIGNERMITLAGDLVEKTGVMRGGFRRYTTEFTFKSAPSAANLNDQQLEQLEQERIELLRSIQEHERNLNQSKIDTEIEKSKVQLHKNTIASLSSELQKIQTEIKEQDLSGTDKSDVLEKYIARKDEITTELEQLEEKISSQRTAINDFNAQEEQKKQELLRLQHNLQDTQLELNKLNDQCNSFKVSLAKIETRLEDLNNELLDEIGPDYPNMLSSEPIEINVEQVHDYIKKIKDKLAVIGGIDPEVIEEFNEVKERYDFLETQIADLNKAVTDTQKIIKELDAVIKEQFESSFKKINKAFNHYFGKLFNGGTAKLELLHEEIIEDNEQDEDAQQKRKKKISSGIEIMANPSNKKITNMNMMSGGEKTMTAISLIAAIISNNRSPFVFLDEVDAALDEANSNRLSIILKELAEITQFIVITHNRVVMHAADILYGVAMGQDGVTQMLSLNIAQAEELAEQE